MLANQLKEALEPGNSEPVADRPKKSRAPQPHYKIVIKDPNPEFLEQVKGNPNFKPGDKPNQWVIVDAPATRSAVNANVAAVEPLCGNVTVYKNGRWVYSKLPTTSPNA